MITIENRNALREKCLGHYPEIAQSVGPVPVTAQFVGQVLKGKRESLAVLKAAKDFVSSKKEEVEALNNEITQITT